MSGAATKTIDQPLEIRGMKLQNRIGFPAMGCTVRTKDSMVTDRIVEKLRAIAGGGPALLVQGQASPSREFGAGHEQLGIWSDAHIEGFRRVAEAVHAEGAKIIAQLQHAGLRSSCENPPCASAFTFPSKSGSVTGRAMTKQEIRAAVVEYAQAARRVADAGYDGVELHASHGWLISNFLHRDINRREDEYGRDRMLLLREIYEGIRELAPDDFVVGVRMSAFIPDLATGLEQARQMEGIGFDYLSLSTNDKIAWLPQDYTAPEGYPFNPQIYSAGEIKRVVNIPVLVAKGINSGEEANAVLAATNVDMVMVGRGMFIDNDWAGKALSGRVPYKCFQCPGQCKLRDPATAGKCPGMAAAEKAAAMV